MSEPSPYCAPYFSRKQAEELLALLREQPQKRWTPLRKAVLKALRENAGTKTYEDAPR